MIVVPILAGVLFGLFSYSLLVTERGKLGKGDMIDKIQAVLLGICGFLVIGSCLSTLDLIR